jgi:uncharacterized protein (DUF4213/DUF364 family)
MENTQIRRFEQANQVRFSSLLQSQNRRHLETHVIFVTASNLANQTLEGQLAHQQIGALLILTDLVFLVALPSKIIEFY